MHIIFCFLLLGPRSRRVFFFYGPLPASVALAGGCARGGEFWSFIPSHWHPAPLHIMYIETVDEWMMLPSSASQLWKPTEHSSMTRELQIVINHSSGSFLFRLPSLSSSPRAFRSANKILSDNGNILRQASDCIW